MKRVSYLSLLIVLLAASLGKAELPDPAGVLSLTPVGEQSCIVVEIPLGPTQSLEGFRWYHNDELVVFPKVSLVEVEGPEAVAVSSPLATWTHVGGPSQGWAQLSLEEPLGAPSGRLLVVFQLPANQERIGEGRNGGPAMGYWEERSDRKVWFGEEGKDWYPLSSKKKLAFEAKILDTGVAMTFGDQQSMLAEQPRDQSTESYETGLMAPHPNPSNPSTEFRFSLAKAGQVKLVIYNQRGEKVWEHEPREYPAGPHMIQWLGEDHGGSPVASGVYFVKMQALGEIFSQRVTLVR